MHAPAHRVVTYNAHGCVGTDGKCSVDRIADVLAACDPDVVGLQEIDVGRTRSGGVDQAEALAVRLGMTHVFGAALHEGRGCYGNAVLARHPIEHVRTEKLPAWWNVSEPRCFVHTRVELPDADGDGAPVDLVVTHFGLGPFERIVQARHVIAELARTSASTVLLGDLNCGRGSVAYAWLTSHLRDAQHVIAPGAVRATFPAWRPVLRLDHVLVGAGIGVLAIDVPTDATARVASDHLPVVATLARAAALPRALPTSGSRARAQGRLA